MEYVFVLLKSIVEYSFRYILIEIYLSVFHEVQLKNPAFDSHRELKLLLRLDSLPTEKEETFYDTKQLFSIIGIQHLQDIYFIQRNRIVHSIFCVVIKTNNSRNLI